MVVQHLPQLVWIPQHPDEVGEPHAEVHLKNLRSKPSPYALLREVFAWPQPCAPTDLRNELGVLKRVAIQDRGSSPLAQVHLSLDPGSPMGLWVALFCGWAGFIMGKRKSAQLQNDLCRKEPS